MCFDSSIARFVLILLSFCCRWFFFPFVFITYHEFSLAISCNFKQSNGRVVHFQRDNYIQWWNTLNEITRRYFVHSFTSEASPATDWQLAPTSINNWWTNHYVCWYFEIIAFESTNQSFPMQQIQLQMTHELNTSRSNATVGRNKMRQFKTLCASWWSASKMAKKAIATQTGFDIDQSSKQTIWPIIMIVGRVSRTHMDARKESFFDLKLCALFFSFCTSFERATLFFISRKSNANERSKKKNWKQSARTYQLLPKFMCVTCSHIVFMLR